MTETHEPTRTELEDLFREEDLALTFKDGRPVPRRGAAVEKTADGVYVRWPDRSGVFYARSLLHES